MTVPNVLATRYAAADLAAIWSPEHKIVLERQLWVAVPSTRSGRRAASPRASRPPRLCPTIVTLRSRFVAIASIRRSRASEAARVHPTLACIVER